MLSKKIIKHTDISTLIELDEFIKSNQNGIKTFRYFSKRPYTIIKNHIYTCLYYINNICVGYGHLDFENDKTWLGIIVSDNETGKKIGDQIMDDLISNSKNDIYLSVDINNNLAVYLYEKKGFEVIEKKINYYLMKLIK